MPEETPKTKIAILGGGVSSMVAAFELTERPELRDKYDITVYQMGWRLGGKGASARNLDYGDRIEEHGLHIWFGFYENAFNAMRRCYAELGRPPEAPLATWKDAFKPTDWVILNEKYQDRWVDWPIRFPTNFSEPGDGTLLPTLWDMLYQFLQWMWEILSDLLDGQPDLFAAAAGTPAPQAARKPAWWQRLIGEIGAELTAGERFAELELFELAHKLAEARKSQEGPLSAEDHGILATLLNDFKAWLWDHVVEPNLDNDGLRAFWITFDMGTALFLGVFEDRLFERGFDSVNELEFRDWLRSHGAREHPTLKDGPPTRGIYDLCFAYEDGDIAKPNMAAGTAARGLLRLGLTYKGAVMWKMQAGMGDTVFTPFYEVLKRRGVKFKFFHCVQKLGLSEDKKSIASIQVMPQVQLKVEEYDPLMLVKGLPCWPGEPLWYQIERGQELKEKLKREGTNLEEVCSPWPDTQPITLRAGQDFDLVVLGISVAALPPICQELSQHNPRFKQMLDETKTTMTQGFQIWLNRDLDQQLGWRYADNSVMGSYVEPVDTYANMSHLIERENWPDRDDVKDIAYFCGVLKDVPGENQAEATERARRYGLNFLNQDIEYMWPKATRSPRSQGIDWALLVDPENRTGAARFDAQFWRANFQPTERYVLSVAKSIKYRLQTHEAGYDNLYLTGDWIKNGFDAGCVEAATMAGMQAARAICGYPQDIVGEHDGWLNPSGQVEELFRLGGRAEAESPPAPGYVEYGGLTTVPSPVACQNARLYGFILEGDRGRIQALCRQVFEGPSRGQVLYQPLTHYVMLTFGDIPQIIPRLEPFSRMGTTSEKQVALWVLTAAVRRSGGLMIAERLAWFVPYMFVHNPISFAGGREIYGWAKNWGWIGWPQDEERPERFSLDAFGIRKFGAGSQAGRLPLLAVDRLGQAQAGAAASQWGSLEDAFTQIKALVLGGEEAFVIPGLELAENLFHDLTHHQVSQVFLKQFRSATDGLAASSQAIVEAATQVEKFNGLAFLDKYQVTLHSVDSHPLAADLGLKSQAALLSFRVDMDFVLEDGTIIWQAGSPERRGCLPLLGRLMGGGRT
jgi:uncharacterized protein with NAD-binding domain and iron-sulfur cluster